MQIIRKSAFSPLPLIFMPAAPPCPIPTSLVVAILMALATPGAAAADRSCGNEIRVTLGDTLSSIAAKCGTDIRSLIAANSEISNPNLVVAGMILRIPGAPEEPRQGIQVASPDLLGSKILLEPIRTSKGARLRVTGAGLPARTWIWIKAGWGETSHILVGRAWTDRHGSFQATLPRPEWRGSGAAPETYKVLIEVPSTGRALMAEAAPPSVPSAEVSRPEKSPSGPAPVRPGAG